MKADCVLSTKGLKQNLMNCNVNQLIQTYPLSSNEWDHTWLVNKNVLFMSWTLWQDH